MRFYTVAEARALLPRMIPLVTRIRDAYVELRALQAATAAQARGASGDGHLLADPWAEEGDNRPETLNRQLQTARAELDRLGIELKDPERGLIDFWSTRDGETIYLCYLLGEPDLLYWHSLADGFAGRRLL